MPSSTRIFSEQQGCCCVTSSGRSTVASVFASPLRLHCRALCIDDMLRNLWCAIRLYKVFVKIFKFSIVDIEPLVVVVPCVRTAAFGQVRPPGLLTSWLDAYASA